MAIEAGVAAKAAAGLCVVGGGCGGVYYGYHYVTSNKKGAQEPQDAPSESQAQQEPETSKYDDALLEYMGDDKRDIVFKIKKNNADLTTQNLTFDATTNSVAVQVEVISSTATDNSSQFKVATDGNATEALKKIKDLNGTSGWTWTCEFTFTKTDGLSTNDIKDETKNQIMGGNKKGLFNLLKEDLTTYTDPTPSGNKWTKALLREEKKAFIKACAKARTTENNEALKTASGNDVTTKLKVTKTFEFVETTGSEPKKLEPKAGSDFATWFKNDYGTKEYNNPT